jgi:hypothetical protein
MGGDRTPTFPQKGERWRDRLKDYGPHATI